MKVLNALDWVETLVVGESWRYKFGLVFFYGCIKKLLDCFGTRFDSLIDMDKRHNIV